MENYNEAEQAQPQKLYRYVCHVKDSQPNPQRITGSKSWIEFTFTAEVLYDTIDAVTFEVADRFGFDKQSIDLGIKSIEEILV